VEHHPQCCQITEHYTDYQLCFIIYCQAFTLTTSKPNIILVPSNFLSFYISHYQHTWHCVWPCS